MTDEPLVNAARLIDLMEEMRDLIGQGRLLLKDLRHELAETRRVGPSIIESHIMPLVKQEVEGLNKSAEARAREHINQLIKAFDDIFNTLIGNTNDQRRQGRVNFIEFAHMKRELENNQIVEGGKIQLSNLPPAFGGPEKK